LLKIISVAVREMSEGDFKSKSRDLILQKIFITKLFEKKPQHLLLLVVLGAKSVIEDEVASREYAKV
jgi:hypothetical protein